MSRLVNISLKLKDGRSIMVTVDEDKVDRFRNGPDKLLDALAKKYPNDLPTKPVYISVHNNNNLTVREGDKPETTIEEVHTLPMITGKGTFHWERNDVLTLIRLRSEKEPIFSKFGIRKKDVWVMIAEEFQAKGFNVTSGQCEQKWKNITKNYRDTVDYSYFSNTHRECPFYKELAVVYAYDPKEKHSGQQPGMNIPGISGGSSGLGPKNNAAGTIISSSEDFSNYSGMDTAASTSARLPENISENFQQETYLQEVTPDISVDMLFQTPEVKQEIIDDDDDDEPIIIIPPSPPPPTPPPLQQAPAHTMVTTSVASLLSPHRDSHNFQACSLPQMTHSPSIITSQCNIPSPSILLSSSSPLPVSIAQSVVKQEPIPVSLHYSSPASNACLQPQISKVLQVQQINSTPQTSFPSVQQQQQQQLQPSRSSGQSHQHQTPSTQTRKRPRESLSYTSPSSGSVSDMLAYRRRLLRRTPFSVPNSMLDMLKQMNEERRREHRTLLNTLNQHHEDLLDLFKQHQQEYLHQEEIKQALLSELIERMSKN